MIDQWVTIVELRRNLFLQARIASYMGASKATASRLLRRAGRSGLSELRPDGPVQLQREDPGKLPHIDITKGRFGPVGHGITGDRRQSARRASWAFVFVAVDDHS